MAEVPAERPATTPADVMVATEAEPLVQVPPDTDDDSAEVLPAHTDKVPEIVPADAVGDTVTACVLTQPDGVV
jgi:hypothetical protein